jgi:hypothetical protein
MPLQLKQVACVSINRTVDVLRTEAWNVIKNEYNIHQADLYDHLVKNKSSPDHLVGSLVVKGPHIPISEFNVNPGSPQPTQHPFVTFNIRKVSVSYIPESFVAVMPSGHKGLFVREDPGRLPIRQLFTIGGSGNAGSRERENGGGEKRDRSFR